MTDWLDILAPASVASIVAFQFSYFASKYEIRKIETRIKEIETEHSRMMNQLTEISTKLDFIISKDLSSQKKYE